MKLAYVQTSPISFVARGKRTSAKQRRQCCSSIPLFGFKFRINNETVSAAAASWPHSCTLTQHFPQTFQLFRQRVHFSSTRPLNLDLHYSLMFIFILFSYSLIDCRPKKNVGNYACWMRGRRSWRVFKIALARSHDRSAKKKQICLRELNLFLRRKISSSIFRTFLRSLCRSVL